MTTLKTLKNSNQLADTILDKRTSYANTLSPVKRVLGHFFWDPGLMNVTISRQKINLLLKSVCNTVKTDLRPKKIGCIIKK